MQDIREVADSNTNEIWNILNGGGAMAHAVMVNHAAMRAYAIDLLMNLSGAIMPTNDAERAMVAWLQGEIVRVAQNIPEA